jgi:hypothetical protein
MFRAAWSESLQQLRLRTRRLNSVSASHGVAIQPGSVTVTESPADRHAGGSKILSCKKAPAAAGPPPVLAANFGLGRSHF